MPRQGVRAVAVHLSHLSAAAHGSCVTAVCAAQAAALPHWSVLRPAAGCMSRAPGGHGARPVPCGTLLCCSCSCLQVDCIWPPNRTEKEWWRRPGDGASSHPWTP
jgi:hypothetical protein